MPDPVIGFAWEAGADAALGLPTYVTAGAAGADLRANFSQDPSTPRLLPPAARLLVPTGLRMMIPAGYEVQIRARSGLALKHGISLANGVGTIDSDYRGAVGVILINHGSADFVIRHGDRIAQMVVAPVVQARFALAGLDETGRGAGGFGSTGGTV